jgi:hypothetical protein
VIREPDSGAGVRTSATDSATDSDCSQEASEGITVNAVHLVVAGNLGDVVLGSVSSAVHNCAT